jgi:hypothetical protein
MTVPQHSIRGMSARGALADLLARLFVAGPAYLVCLDFPAGLLLPNTGSLVPIRVRRTLRVKGELR